MLSRGSKILQFKVMGGEGFPINTKDAIRNIDEKLQKHTAKDGSQKPKHEDFKEGTVNCIKFRRWNQDENNLF